jgi:RNA polymerase sigma-70 factor (ECF subfamily)
MDEVHEFCKRVLGDGAAATEAAEEALAHSHESRMQRLAVAARACRTRAELGQARAATEAPPEQDGLAEAVARELAAATASLPERQREALALRELLGLSHEQIATVMGVEQTAVAPLLARARLGLRAQRRGTGPEAESGCAQRDRALRALVCRQDSEPLRAEDDIWLLDHLGECEECTRAHGAMLEASVCYRAWSGSLRSVAADTLETG